jgi:hypothetical protein
LIAKIEEGLRQADAGQLTDHECRRLCRSSGPSSGQMN